MDLRHPMTPGMAPTAPSGGAGVLDGGGPRWDPGPASPAARARCALIRTWLRPEAARLLDIGCGSGRDLLRLAPWIAQGIGVADCAATLRRARDAAARCGAANLGFALGDAVLFSLAGCTSGRMPDGADPVPGRFDVVVFRAGHVDPLDLPRQLAAAGRRLDPGGVLLVLAPDARHPAWRWGRMLRGEADAEGPTTTPPLIAKAARTAGLSPVSLARLPWTYAEACRPRAAPAKAPFARLREGMVPGTVPLGGFGMALRVG